MKTTITLITILTAALFCNAQTRNNSLLEEARKQIIASNEIYSDLANKNDGTILTRYTDDACLFPPNASPVCGKDNLANFFKDGPKVYCKFTIQSLYGDAREFVTEESFYEMNDIAGNKLDEGKVIIVWKKTSSGWKMYRDMFSSNRPLTR